MPFSIFSAKPGELPSREVGEKKRHACTIAQETGQAILAHRLNPSVMPRRAPLLFSFSNFSSHCAGRTIASSLARDPDRSQPAAQHYAALSCGEPAAVQRPAPHERAIFSGFSVLRPSDQRQQSAFCETVLNFRIGLHHTVSRCVKRYAVI